MLNVDRNDLFLKNRNILLIAPVFFDYYKKIIEEIELLGGNVSFIADAPSDCSISKALGRINKHLIALNTKKYFESTLYPTIENAIYDYVLVIGGMTFSFSKSMVLKIKQALSNACFIIYLWDSIENVPYFKSIVNYFDSVFTFDRKDAERYRFLPLFYSREYEEIGKRKQMNYMYDCSYIGTAHPKKFYEINEMSSRLLELLPRQYIYHYMPSQLKYYYHKLFAPEYEYAKKEDFKYDKITTTKIVDIFNCSRCILDAPQEGQTGLTMRTIECLGAKRKLITTNRDIVNYDFYCPENILVFDDGWNGNDVFFNTTYKDINVDIYLKYSLRNWLKSVFSL